MIGCGKRTLVNARGKVEKSSIARREFDATTGFLCHWDTAVWRKSLAAAESWTRDEFFDVDDFPRRAGGQP